MSSIAEQLDQRLQAVDPVTAERLERLVRDALDLVASPGEAGSTSSLAQLFAAMDDVKDFAVVGRLTRDETHAR
jgi:hypothetical protein